MAILSKSERSPQDLPKVLMLNPPLVFQPFESEFSLHFHFLKAYDSPLPTHQFLAQTNAADVLAIFTGGRSRISSDVLDHLPSLRCIVTESAGLDYIYLPECHRRGIVIVNARDVYSDDCADYAVGLLVDVLRKISASNEFVKKEGWIKGHFALGNRLRGRRIGIIGLGSIGLRIAKRLEPFGCSIQYNSRKKKPSVSYPFYSDVRELATASDVLILCCALSDQTRHMINKEVLSALGKEGVIISIARGPIIDEKELVRSLQEGEIAGAGLDVFENEPKVPEELFALDNVVLSPHSAFCTQEGFRDIFELVVGNLQAFFSNKPLISPVECSRNLFKSVNHITKAVYPLAQCILKYLDPCREMQMLYSENLAHMLHTEVLSSTKLSSVLVLIIVEGRGYVHHLG